MGIDSKANVASADTLHAAPAAAVTGAPHSRFFPHPLASSMRRHAALKMLLPFTIAIVNLIVYVAIDTMLPAGQSYGALEYSMDAPTMQKYIDGFTRTQHAVTGLSVGLHLFNAAAYAITLAAAGAFCSLHLRAAGHEKWARVADVIVWIQPLTFALYTTLHWLIMSQFLRGRASEGLPEAQAVVSSVFLAEVSACVLFILAALVWMAVYRSKQGHLPYHASKAQQQQQRQQQQEQELVSVQGGAATAPSSESREHSVHLHVNSAV